MDVVVDTRQHKLVGSFTGFIQWRELVLLRVVLVCTLPLRKCYDGCELCAELQTDRIPVQPNQAKFKFTHVSGRLEV